MATLFELLGGGSPTSILDSTANLAAEKLASSFPPANVQKIFQGSDARFYDGRDPSQVFSSPFSSGVNQNIVNSGILGTDQAQNILIRFIRKGMQKKLVLSLYLLIKVYAEA